MYRIFIILFAAVLFSACSKQDKQEGTDQQTAGAMEQTEAPAKQDISNEALVKIDPGIQKYIDRVKREQEIYEKEPTDESKAELSAAYIAFGDYMTYESSVSPNEGKYHRALVEYRHALKLDPGNKKAKAEADQIEAIYQSLNRPIPSDE